MMAADSFPAETLEVDWFVDLKLGFRFMDVGKEVPGKRAWRADDLCVIGGLRRG